MLGHQRRVASTAGFSALTIHSSRTRFAGRLNSGVRAHMQSVEQLENGKRRGWIRTTFIVLGLLAALAQAIPGGEPRLLVMALGFLLCIPHAYLHPVVWRDPFDQAKRPPPPANNWSKLYAVGMVLVLVGLLWGSR